MILRYESGARVEAVLLAANDQNMRVAIESQSDSVELRRLGDAWQTDGGEAIEIEALIQVPGADMARFRSEMRPRTMTAGSPVIPF
jgi:hypothetical protein